MMAGLVDRRTLLLSGMAAAGGVMLGGAALAAPFTSRRIAVTVRGTDRVYGTA
jgi:hypothetical protein